MDLATALTELAKQVPGGIVAVTFIILYLKKDAELRASEAARIADGVAVRETLLTVQERALTTASKTADIVEAFRQQQGDRR
jgi:hypothetical protein